MDVQHLVEQAISLQKIGNLTAAENLYRQVLAEDPNNADAHHLLSVLRNSQGKHREALNLVNIAISYSRNAIFLNTRGMIFIDLHMYLEAQNELRAALKLNPEYPEAYNNLAITHQRLGELNKATKAVQRAIDLRPDFVQAWATLGSVQFTAKEFDKAEESCQKAILLDPSLIVARINLAKIHYMHGRMDDAKQAFAALELEGVNVLDVAFPHAQILISRGELDRAANLLLRAYRGTSDWSGLKDLVSQEAFFTVLYQSCSYFTDVVGDRGAALELYKSTGEHMPRLGHVIWNNVAKIYYDAQQIDEGIFYAKKALDSELTTPEAKSMAFNNLGVFYLAKEDSIKAIENFKSALEIQPGHVLALGWLLKEKAHICDWDGYESLREQVDAIRLTNNRSAIAPFTPLAVYNKPESLKYWAELAAHEIFDATARQTSMMQLPEKRRPGRIRIGYYSYDFRNHPVAHLTARLFEVHNRDQCEIYAYSYGPDDGSAVRERIKANANFFVDVKDLSVLETAQRIAQDEIDLLIDLTGNTRHNRCQVLGLRPARNQAHWLGFIGTMGSKYYDYIVADDIVAPRQNDSDFTEKVLRLHSGFHVADDTRQIPKCLETKEELGLPEGVPIFGCFAQTFKIQPEHFDSWMEILRGVPDGVLWLANGPSGAIDNLRKEMKARGVDPDRLIEAQRCEREAYLARFSLMDIHLDTFPYTSGTVASDALHAGCPLVTLSGETMVSKMAGSILINSGLPELVAYTPKEYVSKAVNLAMDSKMRTTIRENLLQKSNRGELLSVKNIVQDLENCAKAMLM